MGTYHGEYMLGRLNQALQQHRFRVVILHELLHLLWQLGSSVTPDGMDTHCFSQSDEIRVGHSCVRVSCVVEEILKKYGEDHANMRR